MSDHPLIAEHLAKFGVHHTCLGRNLRGNRVGRRKTSANDDIHQSGEMGPISHEEQEKRLADTKMWVPHKSFQPASIAVQGATGYASKIHLPDPHARPYSGIQTSTANLREIGRAYDALPTRDASAIPHFERMRKEVRDQHDHMTHAMGIKTEVVDHDPYPTVHHMVQDVVNNKRIKVLSTKVTGGHDFLSDEDNDKFRAVHDVFGHAATGRGFDAHGEEAAWLAHSQMFTPHARGAMSSETRGQNSALHINGSFQAQKTALLPRHMWDDTAVSKHLSAKSPLSFEAFFKAATTKEAIGWEGPGDGPWLNEPGSHKITYFSTKRGHVAVSCSDCGIFASHPKELQHHEVEAAHEQAKAGMDRTANFKVFAHDSGDGETIYHCPFCGSGQVIARSDRTIECEFCHTCFTVQVQPQYSAFPQTIDGMPVQVPGMPGQIGADPAGAGGPMDPNGVDPNMGAGVAAPPAGQDPAAGGFPPAEGEEEEEGDGEDDEEDKDEGGGGNPFTSGLRTQAGATLSPDAYIAHLALKHTQDRETTLAAVRGRRGAE